MNTATEIKTALEGLKVKFTGDDLRREVYALIAKLSGPAHRFVRQAVYREITGENILVAQAGINRVSEAAMRYLTAVVVFEDTTEEPEQQPAAEPAAEPLDATEGSTVIRKSCKRRGVIQKIDGDKIHVLLEDGSLRKPNRMRFLKLYAAA